MKIFFPSGHNDVITKAVVSPSGKYVFTGGYDGKLKLWHLKTTKCIKDIKKYDYPIIGISISQDYIAVSTTSFVEILDLNTYEMKKRYNAYYGVFSPNGKYLLLLFHIEKGPINKCSGWTFLFNWKIAACRPLYLYRRNSKIWKLHVLSGQQIFYI